MSFATYAGGYQASSNRSSGKARGRRLIEPPDHDYVRQETTHQFSTLSGESIKQIGFIEIGEPISAG